MKALHLYQGQINAPDQLDCMSTLRTDNSQTLVNALAEIETLKIKYRTAQVTLSEQIERKDAALRVALEALEGTYIGWRGEKSGEAITTIKEALARQLINRGILQLTRPSRAEFKVVDVVQVPKETP